MLFLLYFHTVTSVVSLAHTNGIQKARVAGSRTPMIIMPAALNGLPYGPMFIGSYANAILYGVLVLQMSFYFQTYKKDRAAFRFIVLYLFFAETINTGLIIAMLYEPLITNFGTSSSSFPTLLPSDAITTVLISTPVQIFLGWRIRVISESIWVALAISILAVISMAGGLWLGASVVVQNNHHTQLVLNFRWPALMWLVSSAVADVALTGSLAFYLARLKSGLAASDDLINRMIRLTVQTGLITALFAILDVGCFLGLPNSSINFLWDFSLSKLYTNALISTLNARAGWGKLIDDEMSQPPLQLAFRATDSPAGTHAQSVTDVYDVELGGSHSQYKPQVLREGSQ